MLVNTKSALVAAVVGFMIGMSGIGIARASDVVTGVGTAHDTDIDDPGSDVEKAFVAGLVAEAEQAAQANAQAQCHGEVKRLGDFKESTYLGVCGVSEATASAEFTCL